MDWPHQLLSSLSALQQSSRLCDVALITGASTSIMAHSSVLAAASPTLCSALQACDPYQLKALEVDEGIPHLIWESLIRFIYTGSLNENNIDHNAPNLPNSHNVPSSHNDLLLAAASHLGITDFPKLRTSNSDEKSGNEEKDISITGSGGSNWEQLDANQLDKVVVEQADSRTLFERRIDQSLLTEGSDSVSLANYSELKSKNGDFQKDVIVPSVCYTFQDDPEESETLIESVEQSGNCTEVLDTREYIHPAGEEGGVAVAYYGPDSTVFRQEEGEEELERNNTCRVCWKTFSRKAYLKIHVQSHQGGVHRCRHCDKAFSSEITRQRHETRHTAARLHCETCGRSFLSVCHLRQHRRVHTGEKPYTCSVCGRGFRIPTSMKNHMRTHTGERPYTCKTCHKSFKRQDQLICHRKIHVDVRPVSCHVCEKKFRSKFDYRRHATTHLKEKKCYMCSLCRQKFTRIFSARAHIQKLHPEQQGSSKSAAIIRLPVANMSLKTIELAMKSGDLSVKEEKSNAAKSSTFRKETRPTFAGRKNESDHLKFCVNGSDNSGRKMKCTLSNTANDITGVETEIKGHCDIRKSSSTHIDVKRPVCMDTLRPRNSSKQFENLKGKKQLDKELNRTDESKNTNSAKSSDLDEDEDHEIVEVIFVGKCEEGLTKEIKEKNVISEEIVDSGLGYILNKCQIGSASLNIPVTSSDWKPLVLTMKAAEIDQLGLKNVEERLEGDGVGQKELHKVVSIEKSLQGAGQVGSKKPDALLHSQHDKSKTGRTVFLKSGQCSSSKPATVNSACEGSNVETINVKRPSLKSSKGVKNKALKDARAVLKVAMNLLV